MKTHTVTRSRGEFLWVQGAVGVLALGYAVAAEMHLQWLWLSLAVNAVAVAFLVEGYLHRYVTHNAYRIRPAIEKVLALLSTVVPGTGSPADWAAVHRAHHKYSDTELDPHSNLYTGFFKQLTFQYPNTGQIKASRKLMHSRHHLWMHKYYVLFVSGWAALIAAVFGVYGLVFGVLIPWLMFAITSTVQSYFLHYNLPGSYRSHNTSENSQNSWVCHLLGYGATGWHNNHHARPGRWNPSDKWWEFDTAAWFIRLIKTNKNTFNP